MDNFRAIIRLSWPTIFPTKMSILNTVQSGSGFYFLSTIVLMTIELISYNNSTNLKGL